MSVVRRRRHGHCKHPGTAIAIAMAGWRSISEATADMLPNRATDVDSHRTMVHSEPAERPSLALSLRTHRSSSCPPLAATQVGRGRLSS
ncbi:hypothetical protein BS50DRAFT_569060 [Corynespora cassiicola Philippines]|uniref:Uncharacterized protein n=1 Tax=Corynespora cassiicola Philippines TaxID=1448308 RepID=A0A2T2P857_CORCC|nr:hypothetical protein BS50DRAFT_569060 [Corynespora cassiicola Philippines]